MNTSDYRGVNNLDDKKVKLSTQMAETPELNKEDSLKVLEEIGKVPNAEKLHELRTLYKNINKDVRRTR